MIKLRVKMINDKTLEVCNYKIKNSTALEHLTLIEFLIDEIIRNKPHLTKKDVLKLIKDLDGELESEREQ